jgi:ubiquinone/menaquinone biosynthesis C-methylase UbiE
VRVSQTSFDVTERYESVAAEYYDHRRHPTCANFRQASKALLQRSVDFQKRVGRAADIGCGDSVLAELCFEAAAPLDDLLLVDSSPTMLRHSDRWRQFGASAVIADADVLPFDDEIFDVVVASLGDPFNTPKFWLEARRVLKPEGEMHFTTPSRDWADPYRKTMHYPKFESEFLLQDGREVTLPSIILAESDQIARIEQAGFLVEHVSYFTSDRLRGYVSPKLGFARDSRLVIVTEYVARRIGSA